MKDTGTIVEDTVLNVVDGSVETGANLDEAQKDTDNIIEYTEKQLIDIEKKQQEAIEKAIKARVFREKKKQEELEKQLSKYKEIADSKLSDEDRVDLPEVKLENKKEADDRYLAQRDIDEVVEAGKDAMEYRANELAGKTNRTPREDAEFRGIAEKLTNMKRIDTLSKNGMDESIIDNTDFQEFAKKFDRNTEITDIVDLYELKNGRVSEPETVGDVKTNPAEIKDKENFTLKELENFTREDYRKNPSLLKRAIKSWEKAGNAWEEE